MVECAEGFQLRTQDTFASAANHLIGHLRSASYRFFDAGSCVFFEMSVPIL